MPLIDQNSAVVSLDNALMPEPYLIDSRTEKDRLSFLTDFASLINFYDRTNTINGDWRPFLLKDPIFLLASIAKTHFQSIHALYLKSCLQFKHAIDKKTERSRIAYAIDQLFDQLLRIFRRIERWTYYMQKTELVYNLKSYVIREVKQTYSGLLWAILSLKEQLYITSYIPGVTPVDSYLYSDYDKKIWQQSKGENTYWNLLGLEYPLKENSPYDIYKSLRSAGDSLFDFFKNCITYAAVEFENVKVQKSAFPDTVLLRTFTKLMQLYTDQINGLTEKHLQFYYRDILKQKEKKASADTVYVCADLLENTASYELPVATKFTAGTYEDDLPILFENDQETSLNPATIVNAYTLTQRTNTSGFLNLYFHNITSPGILKKDEEGKIQSWKTFGTQDTSTAAIETLGIVFASPMFFLTMAQERVLTLKFTLSDTADKSLFGNASYFLSTTDSWFPLSLEANQLQIDVSDNVLTLIITLTTSDPEIRAFTVNPDGLDSPWPLFKCSFSEFTSLSNPPQIDTLEVTADVHQLQGFQLYNDFGMLATKKPFQPLGPTPAKDQSFIIGHPEIFSKHNDTIEITIDWDNLPDNFATYYEQYNAYLNGAYQKIIIEPIWIRILKWLHLKKSNTSGKDTVNGFNNQSFQVQFQLLDNGFWKPFNMNLSSPVTAPDEGSETATTTDEAATALIQNYTLFQPIVYQKSAEPAKGTVSLDTIPTLLATSTFDSSTVGSQQANIDPAIQYETLPFSDTSTSGYMKMQLVAPDEGFGVSLYPKVVGAVALYNAEVLTEAFNGETYPMVEPPNVPFTPIAGLFSGNYKASVTYSFDTISEYPVSCFYETPFKNVKIYDHKTGLSPEGFTLGTPAKKPTALPFYPSFNLEGQLFLELKSVIAPARLNLYFELARAYGNPSNNTPITYYYLGAKGWTLLPLLSDSTHGFSCSGIQTVNVPSDITKRSTSMPDTSFWMTIGVEKDPDQYAQTVFLKTNGIALKRTGSGYQSSTTEPKIQAGSIVGPYESIPQIAAIVQPFTSFNGAPAETRDQMNKRVALRLKTKDRIVSLEDYYRYIKQKFPNVYFVKSVFDKTVSRTTVFVVKKVPHWTDSNAFVPLINECEELEIQSALNQRASAFANIQVRNFQLKYVKLIGDITIAQGYSLDGVIKTVNNAINIFLAPWITTTQQQITIDKGLSADQVAAFIKSFKEIAIINSISLQLGTKDQETGTISYEDQPQGIRPEASVLLIPSLDNTDIKYTL